MTSTWPALDQLAEAPASRFLLAGGHADSDSVGQFRVRLEFVRLERLLEPVDADFLELARHTDGAGRIGSVSETRIDQYFGVAGCAFGSGREAHVVRLVLADRSPAELDCGEAHREQALDACGDRLFGFRHQQRRIRTHPIALAHAEQLADGLAELLALDVPKRDVDAADRMHRCATPAVVHRSQVHAPPEAFDVQRVLADQHVAQTRRDEMRMGRIENGLHDLGGGIHFADARDAFVGMDADDQVVLAAVGDGTVDDRLAQDDGLDFRDFHCEYSLVGCVG
jgi:hypothetical protein